MIIKDILEKIYRSYCPMKIRLLRSNLINKKENNLKYIEIMNYFSNQKAAEPFLKELEYLKKIKKIETFPYEYKAKYNYKYVEVFYDRKRNMRYVLHKNKKMYFPRKTSKNDVKSAYNALLIEQDYNSPHLYFNDEFKVKNGDVFLDVGAAEGMIALDNIDKIKKLYIFECQDEWREALSATFEPWIDKVEIVNKYVSDQNNCNEITLNKYINKHDSFIIKMDIEGAEILALKGLSNCLEGNNIRLVCSTNHKENDGTNIRRILKQHNFNTEYSKGFMLLNFENDFLPPYFRRGIIRAWKK
ncbi:MAG: FkbM family methyltransferase [Anaerovorax sp.]|nr:FkbM family methyltransferase [Anaerovorax sp.]